MKTGRIWTYNANLFLLSAFRGELVTTEAELAQREGRSYESASDLLVKIGDVVWVGPS